MFSEIFLHKKLIPSKLNDYGFAKDDDKWCLHKNILNEQFRLTVYITDSGTVDTQLFEIDTQEEYLLYKTSAQGNFVGEVRGAIEEVLTDIAAECFEDSMYKEDQTLRLIKFIDSKYGDELECLWERYPDYGVLRRQDTGKWYGIIMVIPANKLNIPSDERIEIIDLRTEKSNMDNMLRRDCFYPGWHMNKKSWYTIILNDSVSDQELYDLIEESYNLAK